MKKNLHVVLDISGSNINYKVGSCIGICPDNCGKEIKQILHNLAVAPSHPIHDKRKEETVTIEEFLLKRANLTKVTTNQAKVILSACPNEALQELISDRQKWKAYVEQADILSLLDSFASGPIPVQEFCDTLLPCMPRFYSIASSINKVKDEVHLMVASFYYEYAGHEKYSLTSQHIQDCVEGKKDHLPIFLQENHTFTLPEDACRKVIMIGPGTGMAAFRGFLQEREHCKSKASTWLFTGDQREAFDFHYEEELKGYVDDGLLRLDTAFSRDSSKKVYVQDRMWESAKDLWQWISGEDAMIFVSGDAKHMAKDVQAMLVKIASEIGGLEEEAAKAYIRQMRADKRLLLDVY